MDKMKSKRTTARYNIENMTHDDIRHLIQNLKTYQTELELKNEELRNIRSELTKEKLKKDEEFFRELTENSSDIILIVDKMGTITYVSPSVERFLGYRPEELIGKSGFKYIHPADIPRALLDFGKSVLMKETAITNSFRVLHKDGSERILEGFGKNLLNHPTVAGFIMNIHDITERKKAEEALRESEERFRRILENAPMGYYRVGRNGLWQYVNPEWERMHGYSHQEIIGKRFEITQPEEAKEQAREYVRRALSGVTITGEFERRRKDGFTEYHSFNILHMQQKSRHINLIDYSDNNFQGTSLVSDNPKRHGCVFEDKIFPDSRINSSKVPDYFDRTYDTAIPFSDI